MTGLHIHAWLWCCLSLIGFSVIVSWNLQLSFHFLFRGLKALGVRDLTYRLAFLACSVQATNPRVRHFCYYFCFANCIHFRKPQNTSLKNEDLGLYGLQLCKSLICSAWKLYLCCKYRYHFLVTFGSVMTKFFLFSTSLEAKTLMVMMLQQRQLKSRWQIRNGKRFIRWARIKIFTRT